MLELSNLSIFDCPWCRKTHGLFHFCFKRVISYFFIWKTKGIKRQATWSFHISLFFVLGPSVAGISPWKLSRPVGALLWQSPNGLNQNRNVQQLHWDCASHGTMPWRRITVGIVCSDVLIFIEVYRLKLSLVLGLKASPGLFTLMMFKQYDMLLIKVTPINQVMPKAPSPSTTIGPTKMRYFLRGVSIFEIEDHQKHIPCLKGVPTEVPPGLIKN